ncbi:hypothetical protein ACEQ8H_007901 [Pleosporales sp. CAS-2024a]
MAPSIASENPFSDDHVIDLDADSEDIHTTFAESIHDQTALLKPTVQVPILDPLPHLTAWSRQSSISPTSSTSSRTLASFRPIAWTNADLMYLISCLLPNMLLTSSLVFSPPLAALPTTRYPIHLQLYMTLPAAAAAAAAAPPRQAFSKHAPVGTGRPQSVLLLVAESNAKCTSPTAARTCLAHNLLAHQNLVASTLDKYNVLAALAVSWR